MASDDQRMEWVKDDIHEIRADIKALRKELTAYKGFIGGVVFAFSCIGALFGFLSSWFMGK